MEQEHPVKLTLEPQEEPSAANVDLNMAVAPAAPRR